MAQSGIEVSSQWSFLDTQLDTEKGVDLSPVTSLRSSADLSPVTSLRSSADLSSVASLTYAADFGQLTCLEPGDGEGLEDRLAGHIEDEEEELEEFEEDPGESSLSYWDRGFVICAYF